MPTLHIVIAAGEYNLRKWMSNSTNGWIRQRLAKEVEDCLLEKLELEARQRISEIGKLVNPP
jgi:hypothetical protein